MSGLQGKIPEGEREDHFARRIKQVKEKKVSHLLKRARRIYYFWEGGYGDKALVWA